MRTLHTIDHSEARRAVDLIVERAVQMQKATAVAVADSHGDLICFTRMDGAPVSSIRIAMNKAWTAARERKPTGEIGEKVKHPEKVMTSPTTAIRTMWAGVAAFRSGKTAKWSARLRSAASPRTKI